MGEGVDKAPLSILIVPFCLSAQRSAAPKEAEQLMSGDEEEELAEIDQSEIPKELRVSWAALAGQCRGFHDAAAPTVVVCEPGSQVARA
jgi:hypothetical protein